MKLKALVLCRESHSMRMLGPVFGQMGIEADVCVSVTDALELLALKHYAALVVDFDLPAAEHVVRMARFRPMQRRPVAFVLIGIHTDIGSTFHSGANFVLYKPINSDQVSRSFRAAQGFMKPDRRRSSRQPLDAVIYFRCGDTCLTPAVMLDLSERGLAVQASEPLYGGCIPFRFTLPGTPQLVQGIAEVIWADENGRAGILFHKLTPNSHQHLKAWLAKRKEKSSVTGATSRSRKASGSQMMH
jgi:ActR/RegA family two-component response regulator